MDDDSEVLVQFPPRRHKNKTGVCAISANSRHPRVRSSGVSSVSEISDASLCNPTPHYRLDAMGKTFRPLVSMELEKLAMEKPGGESDPEDYYEVEKLEGEPDFKRCRFENNNTNESDNEENYDIEDMDMGEYDAALAAAIEPKPKSTDTSGGPMSLNYSVHSPGDIHKMMCSIVNETHNLIPQVTCSTLRTMLNHVKWCQEQFMTGYYENPAEFMQQARVHERADIGIIHEPPPAAGRCEICFDIVPVDQSKMNCGHKFCDGCWQKYLLFKIMEDGDSQYITCPGCNIIVEDWLVEKYVTDPVVLDKYKHLICNNFVLSNKRLRWCPNAGCNNAIWSDVVLWAPVTCSCGLQFCFNCGLDWHEPLRCDLLQKWIKKQADDGENSHWMHKNTKNCPSCGTTIEKNGGCNHMTCRNKSCHHEFCWICGHDWNRHVGDAYRCNRYTPNGQDGFVNSNSARTALQRYIHYSTRHANHAQGLEYAKRQEESVERMMGVYQSQHGITFAEAQFLPTASRVLIHCRQTLMYTYPLAYYLNSSNLSEMFEANQRDLERETENLSELLETHLNGNKYTPKQLMTLIIDKLTYCAQRRVVLVNCIYEGYSNASWTFSAD